MGNDKYIIAREKYKPGIKCLLLAESPPDAFSERFFYFEEEFNIGDSLYMETMKTLFPSWNLAGKHYKQNKPIYLTKFMNEGFYLEDASSIPIPKMTRSRLKKKILATQLPILMEKLPKLIAYETPVILIGKPVFEICYLPLKGIGLNVLNDSFLHSPFSGFQPEYRTGLLKYLKKIGIR